MVKFNQGLLSDMDVITCWLASQAGDESFEKLVVKRQRQKHQEIIQLEEDVKGLGISKEDFDKQRSIYLLSRENDCSLVQASEIYEKLQQERNEKPKGAYAKIVESLKTPSYGSPKDKPKSDVVKTEEEGQKEEPQGEVEWVQAGTVKLEPLKKKYQRR